MSIAGAPAYACAVTAFDVFAVDFLDVDGDRRLDVLTAETPTGAVATYYAATLTGRRLPTLTPYWLHRPEDPSAPWTAHRIGDAAPTS